MVHTILFLPNLTPNHLTTNLHPSFPSTSNHHLTNTKSKKKFRLPSVTTSSSSSSTSSSSSSSTSSSTSSYQPINVDYLQTEFSGHGVTFEDISENCCIAKLEMENGSVVTLMLPTGLITSYKVPVWHGGTVELLHTSVYEGDKGNAVIEGGVSVAISCSCGDGDAAKWSPGNWVICGVKGSSDDYIQVELISSDENNMVEMKCTTTLRKDTLRTDLEVLNSNTSSLELTGSVLSHLTVSTPEATYAVGLEGSNFINRTLFLSEFGINPPDETELGYNQSLGDMILKAPLFSGWGETTKDENKAKEAENMRREIEEQEEFEENDNYKLLNQEISRIYINAPTSFTIIDRGRRSSVVVGRDGFDELYISSPGSLHEFYSKYAYVCVGQSAMLKPITLRPGDVWRGGQYLHNPNL